MCSICATQSFSLIGRWISMGIVRPSCVTVSECRCKASEFHSRCCCRTFHFTTLSSLAAGVIPGHTPGWDRGGREILSRSFCHISPMWEINGVAWRNSKLLRGRPRLANEEEEERRERGVKWWTGTEELNEIYTQGSASSSPSHPRLQRRMGAFVQVPVGNELKWIVKIFYFANFW